MTGNVFEGTVNWALLDDCGRSGRRGLRHCRNDGVGPGRRGELGTLDPGTYTFRAFEVSVADGDETFPDTKTFVVQ